MLQNDTQNTTINDSGFETNLPVKIGEHVSLAALAAAPAALTGFGQLYVLASDGKPYVKDAAGTIYSLGFTGDALSFKGTIATAAQFPTAALVKNGWTYRVTANVTDNDGTKTNTGQAFAAEAEISWNGTNWTEMGGSTTVSTAISTMTGVALQTLASAGTAALNGFAAKAFVPECIEIVATAAPGTQNGDAEIEVGTTLHGSEICPAHPIPITAAGGTARIVLEGGFPAIAGNATLFTEVTTADTNIAADITVTVRVIGRQF
jgi:hypothetical protein